MRGRRTGEAFVCVAKGAATQVIAEAAHLERVRSSSKSEAWESDEPAKHLAAHLHMSVEASRTLCLVIMFLALHFACLVLSMICGARTFAL